MRFFCMDAHISVIEDFKTANPDIEVVDWCLSTHAWVMNRRQDNPNHINPTTWMNLNEEMILRFQNEYDQFLRSFDGFITGHVMAFVMIYEKYNKPILAINSCRYDLPFCITKNMGMREKFHQCLQRIKNRLVIVSNNKGDQSYTLAGTGIQPLYNPSLCLYIHTKYTPTKPTFLCYSGKLPPHPLVEYVSKPYTWSDITAYRGIIHFPYEISTMSMFEHFTAGCPLFFPSNAYLRANHNLQTIKEYWGTTVPRELWTFTDLNLWIDRSDIYTLFTQSPNTYYFDSIPHLFELLEGFTYKTYDRDVYIQQTRETWNAILDRLLTNQYKTKYPQHLCYNRLPLLANVVYDIDYTNTGVQAQHSYPYHSPLEKNDRVFVKTDYIGWFLKNVTVEVPITLITGVSDISPTSEQCNTILTHPHIQKWIGCNIPVSHPKITKILIGVGEPQRENGNHDTLVRLHKSRVPWNEKLSDVCVPYHSNTHVSRTFEHMLPKMPFEDYMNEIGKYKFVRCVRGNGLDTHRFCEILLMGSVPVIDHSPLDDLYSQFPCVFIDEDRSSFVWDESKYQSFLDMFWLR